LKTRNFAVLLGVAIGLLDTSLLAHHSPSAIFDMKKEVTLKGTVTKVDWINPHIVLYMDAKGEDGSVESWKFESNPPLWFKKVGATRADFVAAIGQLVTIEFVQALDGSKYGYLQGITFANGNEFALGERLQGTESQTQEKTK
jgi:hypothetical protein